MTEKERIAQLEAERERLAAEKAVMRTEMAELRAEAAMLHDPTGEIDGHNHTNELG